MTLGKISTILGIVTVLMGGLSTFVIYIYNYHQTLSTNKDNVVLYLDVSSGYVEEWIYYYNQKENLSDGDKRRLERLIKKQDNYDKQKNKVMGLTHD